MPLPIGDGLTIVPSMGDVLRSIQQQQATIQHTQLQNEQIKVDMTMKQVLMGLTQEKAELLKKQMAADDAFAQAQLAVNEQTGTQRVDGVDPNKARDPTKSEPAVSVATKEFMDTPPMVREVQRLEKERDNAQQQLNTALAFGAHGSPKAEDQAKVWRTELNNIRTQLREATHQAVTDARDTAKQTANMFAAVDDTPKLLAALQNVADTQGIAAARKIAQRLPADERGVPVWNAQTQQALAPLVKQFETVHEQMTDKVQQSNAARQAENLQRERENDAFNHTQKLRDESRADRHLALEREGMGIREKELTIKQAGLKLREKATDATIGARNDRLEQAIENKAQAALDKDESVRKFDAMKKSYDTVRNTMSMLDKYGLRGVSSTEANSALTEYTQMTQNYRSLVGGKWTLEQRKEFDSKLSQVRDFFVTIGQGRKYTPETLKAASAEVERMFNATNGEILKKQLQQQDKVYGRGADPNAITSPANVQQAIKAGIAREWVDKDGQKWLKFDADDQSFPVRDKRKPRREGDLSALTDDDEE